MTGQLANSQYAPFSNVVPGASIATTAPPPPILVRIGSSGTGLNWSGPTGSCQRSGLSGTRLSWVGLGRTESSGIWVELDWIGWDLVCGEWSWCKLWSFAIGVGLCLLWSCCCRLCGHLNRVCLLQPNTVLAHLSYTFNSYWHKYKSIGWTRALSRVSTITTTDPSKYVRKQVPWQPAGVRVET
jgi:hypothetical protein